MYRLLGNAFSRENRSSAFLRGHSKMTSLQKCQNFRPPLPYVTVSHFFIIPIPLYVQANSNKFFL